MYRITTLFFVIVLTACSAGKDSLPDAPASVKAVKDGLTGKKFKAAKAGMHPISNEKQVEWLEPKEGNKTEKDVNEESKSIQMEFINDTLVTISVKGKIHEGSYTVDDEVKEDEKPGIKLRISYEDEEFRFGDGPALEVTYTYVVEGMSNKNLLLLTPRSLNNRKIVILMDRQTK